MQFLVCLLAGIPAAVAAPAGYMQYSSHNNYDGAPAGAVPPPPPPPRPEIPTAHTTTTPRLAVTQPMVLTPGLDSTVHTVNTKVVEKDPGSGCIIPHYRILLIIKT